MYYNNASKPARHRLAQPRFLVENKLKIDKQINYALKWRLHRPAQLIWRHIGNIEIFSCISEVLRGS